ncbi:MAG TPA: pre-peptidase C-terminal domain-containing protein [Candidatus Limnocylindria bacterium]|jgi:hypothetical protein
MKKPIRKTARTKRKAAPTKRKTADKDLKICIERSVELELGLEAPAAPPDTRLDNIRVIPTRGSKRAVIVKRFLWDTGDTLRVRFLDGDPVVQQKVKAVAKEWLPFVNLGFEFGNDPSAEIRISFAQKGSSWSWIGKDALRIDKATPTMNYGWLTPATSDREYHRVVLHEFGHAIGMGHEHESPTATSIPWDKEAVYAYYLRTNGWDRHQVDVQVLNLYSTSETNFTAFDPQSIMLYPIPDELTIGSYAVGWNTQLSAMDKSYMRATYPKQDPGVVALNVGAAAVASDIEADSEVDLFSFTVSAQGRYRVSTTGKTDLSMTLLGPVDPSAVLAWDDDSGIGRNPKIVRILVPGQYWLQLRHHDPTGRGEYKIAVKKV